jgi:rubrerythrin
MKSPSGEPMPDWWWFLGPPEPRPTTKERALVSATRKDTDKWRCMVCGRPYAEHTPEEQASGCKR